MPHPACTSLVIGVTEAGAVGCARPSDEKNVILGKAPFQSSDVAMTSNCGERAIGVVRSFAARYGMDFLNPTSLPDGDFNATAAGPALNLKAIHSATLNAHSVSAAAYSRAEPTEEDKLVWKAFSSEIARACQ